MSIESAAVAVTGHQTQGQPRRAEAPATGPRLCPTCQRPIRALDRSEYTERRADLVIERGLCVCGEPEA
jgi:hypothetical protein